VSERPIVRQDNNSLRLTRLNCQLTRRRPVVWQPSVDDWQFPVAPSLHPRIPVKRRSPAWRSPETESGAGIDVGRCNRSPRARW